MIDAVLSALGRVTDPELDESIVDLGFVDRVDVRDDAVEVVLRLPTFMCAPNFAYLMANDAREAVLSVPGVTAVHVTLRDHMYSDEISVGVSCGQSFSQTFGEQAQDDDLDELRRLFWRKALGMRQEQLVRFLLDVGMRAEEIVAWRVDDAGLPRGTAPLLRQYLDRRHRLGLHSERLITDVDGQPIAAEDLEGYMQHTRRQRLSMTFNALMCRGLLETRYGLEPARKEGVA